MRVCITGMGIKAPDISNIPDFERILRNGIEVIKYNVLGDGKRYLSGVIQESLIEWDSRLKRLPRAIQILIIATAEAIQMAKIDKSAGIRVGIIVGSSGGLIHEVDINSSMVNSGKRLSPFTIGNMNNNSLSTSINAFFDLNASMTFTVTNSCTSGTDAMILGKSMIEANQLDVCIVSGVDSVFTDVVIQGFNRLKILATENQNAPFSGRPFSKGNSFALSEGSGSVILESEASAARRNADILGYLTGGVMNNDGLSIYKSEKSGHNMLKAVQTCLDGALPTYINSQALGLDENDSIEEYVVREGFNCNVSITSIKGMIGHYLGATGVIQTVASLISIQGGFIPPTLKEPDRNHQVPIVTETIREKIESVLITSHGYGGNNSCVLVSEG